MATTPSKLAAAKRAQQRIDAQKAAEEKAKTAQLAMYTKGREAATANPLYKYEKAPAAIAEPVMPKVTIIQAPKDPSRPRGNAPMMFMGKPYDPNTYTNVQRAYNRSMTDWTTANAITDTNPDIAMSMPHNISTWDQSKYIIDQYNKLDPAQRKTYDENAWLDKYMNRQPVLQDNPRAKTSGPSANPIANITYANQRMDMVKEEQKGMNLQPAADGTMYDLNDPASKKEYDENNAYWASVGGYRLKKGGAIGMARGGQASRQNVSPSTVALQKQAREIANANPMYRWKTADGKSVDVNALKAADPNFDPTKATTSVRNPRLQADFNRAIALQSNTANRGPRAGQNPFIYANQRDDLIKQEQLGHDYHTANDGSVWDFNTPDGKQGFDEANATASNMMMKKGGSVKKKTAPNKPSRVSKPGKPSKPSKSVQRYAAGGSISAKKADGCATKGHTKCKMR
jgi:hypothetical protein